MNKIHDLIILGSGPAGWTAAIYAARAGLKPLVISGLQKGGQLTTTTHVENWPGEKSILGTDLMNNLESHAISFGTEVIEEEIDFVNLKQTPFLLKAGKIEFFTKSLIVSTGANAKYLGLDSEKKYMGRGVSGCATCDGFFYKEQDVAVIGGGNTAVEETIYLSNIAKKVTLIHRGSKLKAEKIMIDKLYEKVEQKKVEIIFSVNLKEILGDISGVTGVELDNGKKINLNGIFIAIGHKPNTEIFKSNLDLDEFGYIVTMKNKEKITQTSIPGIFAAGDVQDKTYRQAITSAGSGCQAALDAIKFLEEN